MAKMKVSEIQSKVKGDIFAQIMDLFAEKGEQFADYSVAVPVEVDGKECWAKVSVVCGQLTDTKTSKAFNPFEAQASWEEEKALKQAEAEAKAKAKAEKLAKKNVKA